MTRFQRATSARILQPLRHRDFALLLSGQSISLIGDGFFHVALAWQVYLISNMPTALSFVGLAGTLPLILFVLVGGAFADRYDRRKVMIGADLLRGAAVIFMGVLSVLGTIELWHMAVLMALVGIGDAFFNPASTALVPDLLPDQDLPQANALQGALRRLMHSLVGPAIAGLVIALFGPGPAFVIDGFTFGISAVALFLIRHRPVPHIATGSGIRHTLGQMGEGFAYVRSKPWIWVTLVSALLSLLFFIGPVQVLLPYQVKNQLLEGPEALGLIFAFGGIGSVIMAIAIGHFGIPRRRVTVMYLSWTVGIALMAVYGVMTALWQALLVMLVTHAFFELGQVIWTTMLQQEVPRRLLGRVVSLDWMISLGLVPISYALTGPVSNVLGPGQTMVAGALIGALLTIVLLFVPGVRDPERGALPIQPPPGEGSEDPVSL